MNRTSAIRVMSVVAAAIALLAYGCGREGAGRSDDGGGGPRIVAMSPALAEMLRDLGLGQQIVGRHGFDAWTDQDITVCGDQAGIDVEMLLAVRPTHVLFQDEAPAEVSLLGERHEWTVRGWRLLTLDDVRACVAELGVLFKEQIEPGRCDKVLAEFDRVLGPDAAGAEAPFDSLRVLLLTGVDPPTVVGPGSFHHQMLQRLGGVPAMTEGSRYMVLSAEDVLGVNPDAIILFRPAGSESETGVAAAAGHGVQALGPMARLDIEAVRSGRVAVIDDPMGFVPGTNLIDLALEMRNVLETWR